MQTLERHDIEIVDETEHWLDDEPKCESMHIWPGNEVCSIEVTHIMRTKCEGSYQMCTNHINSVRTRLYNSCRTCKRRVLDCIMIVKL